MAPQMTKATDTKIETFQPGDTIRIQYKVLEGGKERLQPFEGVVIAKRGAGQSKTFTVRHIGAGGIGVERIFPLLSPNIRALTVVKKGKTRRAKLYYLRERTGKQAVKVEERTSEAS
ncbi:MAG: 50S ribosomal protein L19 [bacterium]|nr:50S ribosomal protein L19 [bacterium]